MNTNTSHSVKYLRPHHLLCLGFFEGIGYSDEFSKNMARVLSELTPDTIVELAAGQDDICIHCPNLETKCPNAARYDQLVLEFCGLCSGERFPWGQLRERVQERILYPNKLSKVCGDCQWAYICSQKQTHI